MGWKLNNCLLILLFCSALGLPLLKTVYSSDDPAHELDIRTNEPYFYVKGDIIQIQAYSNITVNATLRVYWSWKNLSFTELIYSSMKETNATWNLPTVNQKAGFYKIEVTTSTHTVTTRRTLIHYTDYSPASLPFNYTWQGVAYTLQGRSLRATNGESWLNITYPKIPFQHTTSFYVNNMSFLIRLQGPSWGVDLLYFTIHSGLKWRINGTLDNPQTFEFKLNNVSKWKQALNALRSSQHLVFDWDDLERAKKAFTWNATTQTLSVSIPSSFEIDPVIFEDGFETGIPGPWDGTNGSPAIEQVIVHHGSNSCEADDSEDYVYETINEAEIYVREYIQVSDLPNDNYIQFLKIEQSGLTAAGVQIWDTDSITPSWQLYCVDGWGVATNVTDNNPPTADTWICVELRFLVDGAAGGAWLYVNGVLESQLIGYDTNNRGNADRVETGSVVDYYAVTAYIDCVVFDDAYIGCEGVGVDVSFGLPETVVFTSGLIGLRELGFNVAETVAIAASLTVGKGLSFQLLETFMIAFTGSLGKEFGALLTETLQFTDAIGRGLGKSFILSETIHILESMTPEGLTMVVSFVLSETMKMLTEVSIPLTIIDEFFQALIFGGGAWLFLIVVLAIALLVTVAVKYGSMPFIFILLFLGVEYLANVSQTSNFIFATVIAWGTIPLLIFIEFRRANHD